MEKIHFTIPDYGITLSGILFSIKTTKTDKMPCLIICHGAFDNKENFFELARFLNEQMIAAIAIDMPGHGDSSGDKFHINIGLWVKAISSTISILENLSEIDSKKIGAFGFSSGGTAVLEAAMVDRRLKTLITLDATVQNYLGFWDTLFFKIIVGIGKFKKKLTGSDLRVNLSHILKNAHVAYDQEVNQSIISDQRIIDAYSAFPFPGGAPCAFVDTISRVNQIKAPTLILHGEEDKIDPPESAERLFSALTCNKKLELIPKSGHSGHLDTQKKKVFQLTVDWAKKYLF